VGIISKKRDEKKEVKQNGNNKRNETKIARARGEK
jgi:hypothetical protein